MANAANAGKRIVQSQANPAASPHADPGWRLSGLGWSAERRIWALMLDDPEWQLSDRRGRQAARHS